MELRPDPDNSNRTLVVYENIEEYACVPPSLIGFAVRGLAQVSDVAETVSRPFLRDPEFPLRRSLGNRALARRKGLLDHGSAQLSDDQYGQVRDRVRVQLGRYLDDLEA